MSVVLTVDDQLARRMTAKRSRVGPLVRRSLMAALAIGALIVASYPPAFAAPGDPSFGSTQGIVVVNSFITLSNLDSSITMSGLPGDPVSALVHYTVETNNSAGYHVTLTTHDEFLPTDPTNTDHIGLNEVTVLDSTTGEGGSLSPNSSTDVYNQVSRSAPGGDNLATNFSMIIPFVTADTYTATFDYVATTN